jgi:G protein-coupled receptor kinase-interacting protein 1 C term
MPSIRSHISEIASVVGSVVSATESSIEDGSPISAALKLKAESSVKALAQCKGKLMAVSAESESIDAGSSRSAIKALTQKLPPLAFEIARETKELVQKIELVGGAEVEDFS